MKKSQPQVVPNKILHRIGWLVIVLSLVDHLQLIPNVDLQTSKNLVILWAYFREKLWVNYGPQDKRRLHYFYRKQLVFETFSPEMHIMQKTGN